MKHGGHVSSPSLLVPLPGSLSLLVFKAVALRQRLQGFVGVPEFRSRSKGLFDDRQEAVGQDLLGLRGQFAPLVHNLIAINGRAG